MLNQLEKILLDNIIKPPVEATIQGLKDNETANVAAIEKLATENGGNVVAAATEFFTSHVKTNNPLVAAAEAVLVPALASELSSAITAAAADVPSAYAAGVAFLEKEAAYL